MSMLRHNTRIMCIALSLFVGVHHVELTAYNIRSLSSVSMFTYGKFRAIAWSTDIPYAVVN